ncbi:hypothetical protein TNCV_1830241 [Trichonephila clavipes]|nr:hypothetical protein TNCV_1830241 [Trichonephila clavipes]
MFLKKNWSGVHTENHIPKKNIEEDLQSTTSPHQVLIEKYELISKKSVRERESSTVSNKNVTNLTKKFAPAQIGSTV